MQTLEKSYLRLSKTPHPSEVRPSEVLQRALNHVSQCWRERGNYSWVCDQFKSIRQDLVIQRIQSELTVRVYEAHAEIALEADDKLEFNQCQSQLLALYSAGVPWPRRLEFTAYRILYYIFVEDYLELNLQILSLTPSERKDPFIKFALRAYQAWSQHNYKQLMEIACNPKCDEDKHCRQLLSWSLDREREYALKIIFKSYRPTLNIDYIAKILGFVDAISCSSFIRKKLGVDAALFKTKGEVDCKDIWSRISRFGVNF